MRRDNITKRIFLISIFFCIFTVMFMVLLFSISITHYTAEASGSTTSTVLSNFRFYSGSSYYREVSLKIYNLYSDFVSDSRTLTLELVYDGSQKGASGVRAGGTVTFEILNSSGTPISSFQHNYTTDYGWNDSWGVAAGKFTMTVPSDGFYKIRASSNDIWRSGFKGTQYTFSVTSNSYLIVDTTAPTLHLNKGSSSGTALSANADGKYYTNNTSLYIYASDTKIKGITVNNRFQANNSTKTLTNGSSYSIVATDYVGKTASRTVVCDTTAPTISFKKGSSSGAALSANSDGKYYTNNTTLYISASDTNLSTVTVAGSSQTNNNTKTLTNGSSYSIIATDKAGNSKTYTVVCDTAAPIFTVNAFYKAGQTVTLSINEDNLDSVTLDGVIQGTTRSWKTDDLAEGEHKIKVTDKVGYATEQSFIIDKTSPIITGYQRSGTSFVDGAKVNELIYFSAEDLSPVTYTFYIKSGSSYNILSSWSNYQQKTIYYDRRELDYSAGIYSNDHIFYTQAEANAYIQGVEEARITKKTNWTTAVQGTIIESETPYSSTGADYWLYTTSTGNKYIFFAESRLKTYITNNLSNYRNSSSIYYFYEEGDFKVRVTDSAGNYTEKKFLVDFTVPTTSFIGTTSGYAKGEFSYQANDSLAGFSKIEYKKPGDSNWTTVETTSVTIQQENGDGTYSFRAYDQAGNVSTISTVILDTTAPAFSVNAFYKAGQTVSITITEINLNTVTLDGTSQGSTRSWSSNNLSEGSHTIIVTDKAGNSTPKTFIVDKTAPVFSVNAFYKAGQTVSITITETNFNNATYDGKILSVVNLKASIATNNLADGSHSIVVTDKAGNSTTKSFIVDKTLPVFTLNAFYNESETVTLSITETNLDYVTFDDVTTTARSWETDDLAEGSHTIRATDKAGNATEHSFIVDKTAPDFSVNAFYNASETVLIEITEVNLNYVTLDGDVIINYTIAAVTLSDGAHTVIAYDQAGHNTKKTFIVDTTAPSYSVNQYYKAGQTVSITVTETNLDVVTLDGMDQAAVRRWNSNDLTNGIHTIVVTDKAGNYTQTTFTIDKIDPTFSVNAFYNASETVTLEITEANLDTVKMDGDVTDERMFAVSDLNDGTHTVIVTDRAGNSTTKSFIVDKTLPSVAVAAFYKAGQTVDPTITEANFDYLTLTAGDTTVYTGARRTWSASTDLNECTYILTVYDKAGNNTTTYFTVDKTVPAFSVNSFYKAGQTVSITITETNLDVVTLDGTVQGVAHSWKTDDLAEGSHTIRATDKAGNATEHSFVVDKTVPAFSVNSFYKAGQTVSITITETNLDVVTLDGTVQGSTRSWSSNNLSEGSHTIVVTDKAGNSALKTFIVDKTAPAFNLNAFYNASETVTLVITEVNFDTVTLDGTATTQREFAASEFDDGSHTVVATDKAGNSTTKTFIIDTVSPDFSVNSYYRAGQTIVLSITESNPNYVTITTIGTTTLTQFSANDFEDGEYSITAVDLAGNTTTKSFIVDKTLPIFSLNAFYNASETVKLAITEVNLNYVTLDGDVISNYNVPTSSLDDGTHTIIVYDLAGNERSKTFIVDKTAPVFTLKEFYAANETISLVVEEANLDYVKLDGVTVAARSWDGTTLSEGAHTITVYDKAKNSATADFYFKTAQPILSLRKNGASASSGVYLAAGDTIQVVISDDQFDHLTLDGVKVTDLTDLGNYQWTETWLAEDLTEGTHTLIVYDKANNETSLVFSIDRTAPTLTFKVNGSITQGYVYVSEKDNLSFSYSDMNVDRCELDGEVTTTTQYSVAALTEFGHAFIVYDKAGNYAEVEFYVDKTAPSFDLNGYYNGENDITLSIVETNLNVVTLDGDRLQGNVISTNDLIEGEHTVAAYDLAGNSTMRSFVLDRTAPAFTLRSYYKASDVILVSVIESNPDRITLDGAVVSSTSWTGADLPDGEHIVAVYDRAGNVTERSFIVDTVSPRLIVRKNGNIMQSGIFYAAHGDIVAFAVTEDNLDAFTLDSVKIEQREFAADALDDGSHSVVVTDKAGNSATVTFIVDKTAPSVTLRKNGANVENGAFYKESTTVSVLVADDNLDYVVLDGVISDKYSWLASELYEGKHTFSAYDKAGNNCSVMFTVDKIAPIIMLNTYYGAGDEISVPVSTDSNFAYVTLSVGSTVVYTGGSTTWYTDDLEECTYILTVYDKAENNTTTYFTVDKTAPVFELNPYYRATETIRIRVSDANLSYIILDDELITNNNLQASTLDDGIHSIIAADYSGNVTTKMFIVDKTSPVIIVSKDYFHADETAIIEIAEENLETITLDGEETTDTEFYTSVLEDGLHSVVVTDKAGNSTTKSFIVDKTAPAIFVNEFYSAAESIRISVEERNLNYVTLDGTMIDSYNVAASTLSEGTHTIKAIDLAGNEMSKAFIVDKTAPVFTLKEFYAANETISLVVEEANLDYVTLDGERTEMRLFSVVDLNEGTHTVMVYDKAKNNTKKTFVVDKTGPAFSVDSFYKAGQTVSITITETNLDVVTLDGTVQGVAHSWKTDDLAEGSHTIRATDKAGNATEHSFVVDKTAPAFELNAYYKASEIITLEIEEEHFSRMTLNGEEILDMNLIAEDLTEGKYTVVVYDLAGNATTKSFIVDKTAPTFSVNAYYNSSETIRIRVSDANPGYVLLDDDVLESANVQASTLDDGLHTFVIYDLAGNATTKSFIVDKTAPILYLADYYSSGKNVYLQPIEDNLDYVTLDGAVAERDIILSDDLEDGFHTVKVYDLAGNSATVTFVVDKTLPVFSLNAFYRASDTLSLRIVEENLRFVELDGLTTDLTSWLCAGLSEGEHSIAVTDFAGNVTTKSFIIDKTYPVVTLKKDGTLVDTSYFKAENDFRIDVAEVYLSVVTLNDEAINDFDVVVTDLEDGKYTVIATDRAGNSTLIEFVIDKTAPSVTLRRNMNDIAPAGVYVSSFDTVSVVIEDVNADRVLFDGVDTIVYSWTGSSLSDGEHTVTAYDKAGNVTTVSFIVHKGAPEFTLQEYYIAGETVLLDVSEEALETVLLDGGETFLRSWLAEDLGEGSHTISVTDKAGNNTTKTFIVDVLHPTVELNKNSKKTDGTVYAKATDLISITISDANLDYVLFDNEVTDKRSWECVLLDEKEHFIVVSDKARNKTTVSFIVDRTAPAFSVKEYYIAGETVFIDVTEENPDGVYLDDERIFATTLSANDLSERTYILAAYDKAGNVTTKSFTVDLLAPILSIAGKDFFGSACTITQDGNSYGEVKISATDIAEYTLYTRLNTAEYVSRGFDYTIAAIMENEGTWSVYAVDANGYTSDVITFTVDFTAPTVVIFDTDADEARKGYTNTAFSVSVTDAFPEQLYIRRENDIDFSLCSQSTFEATLANEGTYQFYAVDKNGLRSTVRAVTLDLGTPTFALEGLTLETSDKGYTNTAFSYSASDRHFAAISYKKAGGTDAFRTTDTSLTIENTKENEGTWLIYAEDAFGQISDTYSVTLNFTFDFRNIENIRNSFKMNTWYTVTLPSRIYSATSRPDIAGAYTFARYDDALAFAVAKEKEYRVYSVTEGGYGYVSVNNENVYVTYPTESELEAAVLHYAIKYVSERKIFNKTEARNVYENITNAGFESDITALTLNQPETPDYLSEYGLPVYFARQSFVPVNNAALSPSSVKMTYIGNLTGAVAPYAFDLSYGESFSAALSRASNLYEGYYLYEESDLCGNKQSAILFIDLSEPTIRAHIERGDGVEDLTVNKDAVADRSGAFYAVRFSVSELFDNADAENLCVNVVSDKYAGTFTATDEFPVLDADFGAGTYSITVYDRSYNFLSFSVVIAGTAPSWSYTSLAANTKKLTVYINKNDRNNALLTLRIVKIRSDGTYIDLTEDSKGTVITPANGTYVLTDGGKYAAIMTDMYGRTIETEPIFYEKGLPSASFDGIRNGGTTNTNVSITYADMYGLMLYYDDVHRTPVNGLQPAYNAEKKTFTVSVEKTPDQTINYLVFVYLLADEGIYIEYTFTIDCEVPAFIIEAIDASPIGANGSTNKPFFVSWIEEGVTAKTQREGYNAQSYQSGSILALNTLYTFELTDKVGNVARFTVYLDSEVMFKLSAGVTIQEEGYVLTRHKQKITIDEEYVSFRLIDRDGKEYAEGEELQNDGFYRLTVIDLYENVLDLEIEIDLTVPVLTFANVRENGLSNQDVTVTCDEYTVVIEKMTSNGSSDGEIKSGTVFSDEGFYSVRATDRAGNITKYDFTIDKTLKYTCTAENGLFTTADVSFTFSENVAQKVTINGEDAEASLRYTVPGAYVVIITDAAGNEETVSFDILNARQQKLIVEDTKDFFVLKITHNGEDVESAAKSITLTESGKYEVTLSSSKTDKSYYFAVELDNTAPEIVLTQKNGKVSFSGLTEKGVTFMLYKDGKIVEGITEKSTVSEKGNYVLVLTDECGNVTQYEFEVKFTLNAISIALIALGAAIVVLLTVLFIRGHRIKAA